MAAAARFACKLDVEPRHARAQRQQVGRRPFAAVRRRSSVGALDERGAPLGARLRSLEERRLCTPRVAAHVGGAVQIVEQRKIALAAAKAQLIGRVGKHRRALAERRERRALDLRLQQQLGSWRDAPALRDARLEDGRRMLRIAQRQQLRYSWTLL